MINKINSHRLGGKNYYILLCVVFIILYTSCGYFCKNNLRESINVLISFIVIIVSIHKRTGDKLHNHAIVMTLILSILGMSSSIIAGDSIKMIVYPVINFSLALIFVYMVKFEDFQKAFRDVMCFITVVTIITYVGYKVYPTVFKMFPLISNTANNSAYNLFFTVIQQSVLLRAQSFFWEPGVYQTFLNIALLFEIMQTRISKQRVIVMIIGIVLTFSTTGYITAFVNIMILIIKTERYEINKFLKLLCTIIATMIILYLIIPFIPKTINGISFGFEKIERFLKPSLYTSGQSYDSASVRHDSIVYPLKLFLQKPIIGSGYTGLWGLSSIMKHNMVTCTPVNFFALYGIIYGVLILSCIYSISKFFTKSLLIRALIFIMFLLSILTEHYVNYLILDIFILYGSCRVLKKN